MEKQTTEELIQEYKEEVYDIEQDLTDEDFGTLEERTILRDRIKRLQETIKWLS